MIKVPFLTGLFVAVSVLPCSHHIASKNAIRVPVVAALSPEQHIRQVLLEKGIATATAELILAQARLESGHFTSNVFNQANNPFGMRPARVRISVACGQYNGYASYAHVRDAAIDFVHWLEYACLPAHILTAEEYVAFLYKKKYFEDCPKRYLSRLRQIAQETQSRQWVA